MGELGTLSNEKNQDIQVLLSVLESQMQAQAVVLHRFRFGSSSVHVSMSPGVSLSELFI